MRTFFLPLWADRLNEEQNVQEMNLEWKQAY